MIIDQVEALEDEADVALARVGQRGFAEGRHFLAVEQIGSAGRAIEHAHNVEQGRLAAP
jgi:hypothetical protein